MIEMIFDTCQRLVSCSEVRDLIVERWQSIFSDPSTLRYHNHFGTLCILKEVPRTVIEQNKKRRLRINIKWKKLIIQSYIRYFKLKIKIKIAILPLVSFFIVLPINIAVPTYYNRKLLT
jgi:hypothetical protein